MKSSTQHRPLSRWAVLASCVAVTAGCTPGPVHLPDPQMDAETRATCEAIHRELPATVLDQKRRGTTGQLSAAWGDPAITLTCGVPKPDQLRPDSRCFEVNGVGWFAQEGQGGWVFTTIGRQTFVQLGVPNAYASPQKGGPEANALVDVAAAVSAHDALTSPCL